MRIVYLITRMDSLGGAQVHVRDMALAMSAAGHEVYVLSGSEGPFTNELASSGINMRISPGLGRSIHPWRDVLALGEIVRTLSEIRADILSLHSSKAGWLGRVAGRLLDTPTIFTAHGWSFSGGLPWYKTRCYRGLERLVGHLPARTITVCEGDRQLAIVHRLTSPARVSVIRNGVHDLSPAQRALPGENPVRIVMVARFQEPKRHSALLEALGLLREMPWVLEFIGDGPLQSQMVSLSESMGFGERVCFSGACTDVAQRLAQAQLFVLVSSREGFPRSILEAMRAGLPVIASDVGGVREAVLEGKTGFLVQDGDHAALVSRLRLLLSDPEMRIKMGRAGRERFAQDFTFEVMFRKTVRIYTELLGFGKQVAGGGGQQ